MSEGKNTGPEAEIPSPEEKEEEKSTKKNPRRVRWQFWGIPGFVIYGLATAPPCLCYVGVVLSKFKEEYVKAYAGNPASYKHKVESLTINKDETATVLLRCTQEDDEGLYSYNKKLILDKREGKIKVILRERWPLSIKYEEVLWNNRKKK